MAELQKFHLIDDEGKLQEGLKTFIQDQNMSGWKRDYNIVSIIGLQSSGKSTLLNYLFGTCFKVMNKAVARTQTTKGIYASKDKESDILVLDIEGTDSVQRWEEKDFYSKSTGIFALALSQVLVINIWTSAVGTYEGQQLGIIQTIFEMNLKLFDVDQCKNIVFVLRDYHESENLEHLTNSIEESLTKLWQEITKPEKYANHKYSDLFKIQYIPLPNIVYEKQKFEDSVQQLRNRFTDKSNSDYFFADFDYSKNLPIDDLEIFTSHVWETTSTNKDINLPNEKEIVAQIRCEQIKKEALERVRPTIDELDKQVKDGVSAEFSILGKKAYNEATEFFSANSDYMPKIVSEKLEELKQALLNELYSLFVIQMSQGRNRLATELDEQLSIPLNLGITQNLQYLAKIQFSSQEQVKTILENSIIIPDIWDTKKAKQEFDNTIEQAFENKFLQILTREYHDRVDNMVVQRFNEMKPSFWKDLQGDYDVMLDDLEEYLPIMKMSAHKTNKIKAEMYSEIFQSLEHKMKEKLMNINDNMLKKFQKLFRNTENDTPCNWKGMEESEIEEKFKNCKKQVLDILELFKFNNIKQEAPDLVQKTQSLIVGRTQKSEGDVPMQTKGLPRLLNEIEIGKIISDFEKAIAEEMASALRQKNQTDIMGIPKAFWFLLIFFGYDDILRMLSNPFLMTPIIMVLGAIALAFSTGNQQLVFTAFKFGEQFVSSKVKDFMKK